MSPPNQRCVCCNAATRQFYCGNWLGETRYIKTKHGCSSSSVHMATAKAAQLKITRLQFILTELCSDLQRRQCLSKQNESTSANGIWNTHPNFNMKINCTMWTTFRMSYDSKIPKAFKIFEMTSNTMYRVNLRMKRTARILDVISMLMQGCARERVKQPNAHMNKSLVTFNNYFTWNWEPQPSLVVLQKGRCCCISRPFSAGPAWRCPPVTL